MSNVELPEKAKKILSNIRKKSRVEFSPVKVGRFELNILQASDLESLLSGMDPFKDTDKFPYWSMLWEASIILGELMATVPPERDGHTVLELGAGLGTAGLAAAANGYTVTLSDCLPQICDYQKVSAAANSLTTVTTKVVDYKKPPKLPQFDTIIGAEILFREESFKPILKILDNHLAPGGTIYFAHDDRRKSLSKFFSMAEEKYRIAVKPIKFMSDQGERTVLLTRLKPVS